MIVDTLNHFEQYVSVNPLFADVLKFMKENDLNKLEEGKHFIKDKDLFVNITTAKGPAITPFFALKLLEILEGKAMSDEVAEGFLIPLIK